MMEQIILAALIKALGDRYNVIDIFDGSEAIDLSGAIAVNVTDRENLYHGKEKDFKFSVTISGQTLADQDKDKSIIQQMLGYCISTLDADLLRDSIANCAGVLLNGAASQSDGDTNNFEINLEFFCCDCD